MLWMTHLHHLCPCRSPGIVGPDMVLESLLYPVEESIAQRQSSAPLVLLNAQFLFSGCKVFGQYSSGWGEIAGVLRFFAGYL